MAHTPEEILKQRVQLYAASFGTYWKNSSGAFTDKTGRLVRFGLGNVSADINRRFKSSDDIGVTPVLILPEHVGRIMGIFTAFEFKRPDKPINFNDKRVVAQKAYHDLVRGQGGFAGFVRDEADVLRIIGYGK